MKKGLILFIVFIVAFTLVGSAQCSLCTKTAQQLGEGPALGLNKGIVYLMLAPFAIVGFIGFRWWKGRQENDNV